MKKTIISILGLTAIMLSVTSCGGDSVDGAALAKEICECTTKANALPGDYPNRDAEQEKCSKLQVDGWAKVEGDPEQEKKFNGTFPCGF